MNNVTKQVVGVVVAVAIFAMLGSVGYLAQVGWSQTFGPGNTPSGGNVQSRSRGNNADSGRYSNEPRDPIPDDESVWEDVPEGDLDYAPRLPDRPGNFEVTTQLARFFDGLYAVEPDYPDIAFPFWDESKKYETEEAWNAYWDAQAANYRAKGNHRANKLRRYNFELVTLKFVNVPADSKTLANFADLGLSQKEYDQFVAMREAHKERCVLVLVAADLESLESDKVESIKEDDPMKLFFVRKSDGWKLTYYED